VGWDETVARDAAAAMQLAARRAQQSTLALQLNSLVLLSLLSPSLRVELVVQWRRYHRGRLQHRQGGCGM
jgi:hypothetical protein